MSTTEYDIIEEDSELVGTELVVYVSVHEYVENHLGTSDRGEDYYDQETIRDDVINEHLPLHYVRPKNDEEAVDNGEELLKNASQHSVKDIETVEFVTDGETYIATFDADSIAEYRW